MGLKLKSPKELRELGVLLAFLKQPQPPASFKETLSMLPLAKRIFAISPQTVSKAAFMKSSLTNQISIYCRSKDVGLMIFRL